uniref:Uncharacterized protein n=1 Tax=Romanomermis culicivorax TaxID=13658 RepID=A0A915KBA3_ROMCU
MVIPTPTLASVRYCIQRYTESESTVIVFVIGTTFNVFAISDAECKKNFKKKEKKRKREKREKIVCMSKQII